MNLYILEANYDKAKEIGNKILSNMNISFIESTKINNYTNNYDFNPMQNNNNSQFEFWNEQINMNLRFSYIQIFMGLRDYSNALIMAIKFHNEIKQLDFTYEFMLSCLVIAKILVNIFFCLFSDKFLKFN
jgi:hypothetical protein